MPATETAVMACGCCRLPQPAAIDRATGIRARVCDQCTHHQGEQELKCAQRAESHERMLRERLDKCRASEGRAATAAAEAKSRVQDARRQTAAALATRGRLAARIVEAAAESGNHRCAVAALARETDVMAWAKRAELDEQAEQSARLRDQLPY